MVAQLYFQNHMNRNKMNRIMNQAKFNFVWIASPSDIEEIIKIDVVARGR